MVHRHPLLFNLLMPIIMLASPFLSLAGKYDNDPDWQLPHKSTASKAKHEDYCSPAKKRRTLPKESFLTGKRQEPITETCPPIHIFRDTPAMCNHCQRLSQSAFLRYVLSAVNKTSKAITNNEELYNGIHKVLTKKDAFWPVVMKYLHEELYLSESYIHCFCQYRASLQNLFRYNNASYNLENIRPVTLPGFTYSGDRQYTREYTVLTTKKKHIQERVTQYITAYSGENNPIFKQVLAKENTTLFPSPTLRFLILQLETVFSPLQIACEQSSLTPANLEYEEVIELLMKKDPLFNGILLRTLCLCFKDSSFLGDNESPESTNKLRIFLSNSLDWATNFKIDWRGLLFTWADKVKKDHPNAN